MNPRLWPMLALLAVGCGKPTPPLPGRPPEVKVAPVGDEAATVVVGPTGAKAADKRFQMWILPAIRALGGEVEPRVDTDSAHPTAVIVHFRKSPPDDEALARIAAMLADNDAPLVLDLENSPAVSTEGVRKLASAKNVIGLRLASTRVRRDIVPTLAALTSLEELTLSDDAFDDADLARLAGLTEMRLLTLFSRGLTEAGLKSLSGMKRLREFRHTEGSPSVGDAGLAVLSALPHLRSLRLDGPTLTDAGFAVIRNLADLETLTLSRTTKLTGKGFAATAALVRLRSLTLVELPLKGDDYAPLARQTALRELTVDTPIDDAALRHIGQLPGIRSLGLAKQDVGDAGLAHLGAMKSLERLDLRSTRVTDISTNTLAALPKLTELTLDETGITSAGVMALASTGLARLDLSETKIDDAAAVSLAAMPKLLYLDLRGTTLTDASLATLSKMTGLKRLDIAKTKITKEGAAKLQEALAKTDLFYSN